MTRLRVVHVVDSLAATGGAEQRLVEEIEALADRFDQHVVRLYERDDLQRRLEGSGVPVTALGFSARQAGRTWPVAARRLRVVLAAQRPDVVHTTLFSGNLVGQLAARRLGIPVLSSFNRTGDIALQRAHQPGVAGWRGRTMQAVARRVARHDDVQFRAVSADAAATNGTLFAVPPERISVVPRGITVDGVAATDRRSFGLPDAGPLFVNAARLAPEKAQTLLVEAFAAARQRLPDAQLAIAGAPGVAEPSVRDAIARHDLGTAVHLLGWRADVRSLVATAEVFVFSSLSEGWPSAVVEAMAIGTPVVAFAIPPVAEVTGGHARLVAAGDVDELAAAMVDAATTTQRAVEVAEARAWTEQFALSGVAERLGDLLASCAGRAT